MNTPAPNEWPIYAIDYTGKAHIFHTADLAATGMTKSNAELDAEQRGWKLTWPPVSGLAIKTPIPTRTYNDVVAELKALCYTSVAFQVDAAINGVLDQQYGSADLIGRSAQAAMLRGIAAHADFGAVKKESHAHIRSLLIEAANFIAKDTK